MEKQEVLVVARRPSFTKMLRAWLEEAGYPVLDAFDGIQGLRGFSRHQPGFVILDMLASREESFDFLTRIREASRVPVIILSGRRTEAQKVRALELGADDYLVKPVGRMELLARVEAILRRTSNGSKENGAIYMNKDITIDFTKHRVYVQGQEVQLTVLEYKLLTCLVNYSGQVLEQRRLLDEVWGPEYDGCEYVKWHISRLRRKIEEEPDDPRLVVTVRGVGYRYDAPNNGQNGHVHHANGSNGNGSYFQEAA